MTPLTCILAWIVASVPAGLLVGLWLNGAKRAEPTPTGVER